MGQYHSRLLHCQRVKRTERSISDYDSGSDTAEHRWGSITADCCTVSVLNGQNEVFQTMIVEVTLQSIDWTVSQQIVALTTENVTGCMKAADWMSIRNQWRHLNSIQFPRLRSHYKVDMLIDVYYAKSAVEVDYE